MSKVTRIALIVAGGVLSIGMATEAAPIVKDLGGGWEVVLFRPDLVDIVPDFVSLRQDRLVIEKFAEFRELDPISGLPAPIEVLFRQNRPDAQTVRNIIITDEVLYNNTPFDWVGFRNILIDGTPGDASWNVANSAGFSISPFTNRQYFDSNREVFFDGGTVLAGDFWTPGLTSGGMWIDVSSILNNPNPVSFFLKEIPVVPTPGTAALGLIAVGGLLRRRRA